LLYL
jgi:hypothetical protein